MELRLDEIKGLMVEPANASGLIIAEKQGKRKITMNREKLAKIGFDYLGTMEKGYHLADSILSHLNELIESVAE